jgi:hypothetical protein
MGVGIEAEVTNRDLALVGNMGSHPGDELQVVKQKQRSIMIKNDHCRGFFHHR